MTTSSDIIKPKEQAPAKAEEFFAPTTQDTAASVEMNLIPLKGFFGVENPTVQERDQLDFIYKYFDGKVETMSDVLMNLSEMRRELGTAPFGQSQLSHVYNYLRVLSDINKLENLKATYRATFTK